MPRRNESLYRAVKAYLPVAIEFLAKRPEASHIHIAQGMDGFQWSRVLARADLAKLPEYESCLGALCDDPVISRHLGSYVGTHLGGSALPEAPDYMDQLLDLGIRGDRYVFDEDLFEREYEAFEEVFHGEEIWFEAVAYLQGLMIGKSATLSDNLELSQLTEGEVNNFPEIKTRKMSGDLTVNEYCAVRTWYPLKKIVGEHPTPTHEEMSRALDIQRQANDRIEEVINALRLVKIENVYYNAIIHQAPRVLPIRTFSFQSRFLGDPSLWFGQDAGWVDEFRQFWLKLKDDGVRRRKFLDVAIRRFSYGHERHRVEDRVLDLFIAAEALFLADDRYIGEIKYRFSERAALFVGGRDTALCRDIFRHMKAAYDLRSTIAHGRTPDERKLPMKQDGSRMTLDEFVWTIHEYIRAGIHKAVGLAIQPDSPQYLVDWDELIFSAKEEKSQ